MADLISDMATSVVVAFAGIAAWAWILSAAKPDGSERSRALTFALLLALLVNIKQANLVLVIALVVSSGMVALRDREIRFSIFLKRLPLLIGLPLVMYFATTLWPCRRSPRTRWRLSEIGQSNAPELLRYMGVVVYRKALFFALALGFVVWGLLSWMKRSPTPFDRLAIIVGATFVGYNLFLMLIFIAHFGGYPQSYWRFNAYRLLDNGCDSFRARPTLSFEQREIEIWCGRTVPRIGMALVVAVPLLQVATANYWRYDLEVPKPMLRVAGRNSRERFLQMPTVGVIVPGDQGNFTSMFVYYVRQSRADLYSAPINNDAELGKFLSSAEQRPLHVWAYCPADWIGRRLGTSVRPGSAALFMQNQGRWRVVQEWPHRALDGLTKFINISTFQNVWGALGEFALLKRSPCQPGRFEFARP